MTGPAASQGGQRVLVIDDDADILRAVRAVLHGGGLEVLTAADGRAGLRSFHAARPSAVVLDIGLPVLDGWAVLDRIRDLSDVPVLLLTSRDREAEKVRGLRAGADDYVTKPFSNAELLARVKALLRRAAGSGGRGSGPPDGGPSDGGPPDRGAPGSGAPGSGAPDRGAPDRGAPGSGAPDGGEVYDDGLVRIAQGGGEVSVAGRPVRLTPTEYRLLATLVRHPNQVLSPDQLLARAWQDPAGVGSDRVKFAVMRLRRKLGDQAAQLIEAVRGFGYRYRRP